MSGFGNVDLGRWGKVVEIVNTITQTGGQIYAGVSESQAPSRPRCWS